VYYPIFRILCPSLLGRGHNYSNRHSRTGLLLHWSEEVEWGVLTDHARHGIARSRECASRANSGSIKGVLRLRGGRIPWPAASGGVRQGGLSGAKRSRRTPATALRMLTLKLGGIRSSFWVNLCRERTPFRSCGRRTLRRAFATPECHHPNLRRTPKSRPHFSPSRQAC
jgi:hypothetical protein